MGGKPSKGTRADKRLAENKAKAPPPLRGFKGKAAPLFKKK